MLGLRFDGLGSSSHLTSRNKSSRLRRTARLARTGDRSGMRLFEALEDRRLLATTVAPVHPFNSEVVIGEAQSELERTPDGITFVLQTVELDPGTYTVWGAVFNNPENCSGSCGLDDLQREGVDASLVYGAGAVAGDDGEAVFAGSIAENDVRDVLFGPGIVDAETAEIHLVVRGHGPVIPGRLHEQVTTFNGGCDINTCENVQATIHIAPQTTVTVSPVLQLEGLAEVDNTTSRLTRSADGISLRVDTVGLEPGAYTIWVAAFNSPENCVGGCDPADFSLPETNASLIFGSGQVVEDGGEVTFFAQLEEGDSSGARFGSGIVDAETAELHFIIRSHGPVIPEQLEEQLTTFDGGCEVNDCAAVQAGLHHAPHTIISVGSFLDLTDNLNSIPGESRLTRSDDGITLRSDAVNLDPGAYTVWVVAFNNPEFCSGNCGSDDIPREEVNASMILGTGEVVDESGEATFFVQVSEGDTSDAVRGPGIVDAETAEVHFILRTHGPVIPELLEEQLTTLNGGCEVNVCANVQGGIHLPPDDLISVGTILDLTDHLLSIPGESRLTRSDEGITLRSDAVNLEPGAYTVWVVAFNNPEFCSGDCGSDDIAREEVNASMILGTGEVVDESGAATFLVQLDEGDTSNAVRGPGIVDAETAEIHFILRTHGPVISDQLEQQLATLNGGCEVNVCANVQGGIHLPPNQVISTSPTFIRGTDAITRSQRWSRPPSRLTRYADGIQLRVDTNELEPGAYTIWIVVFNNPEFCEEIRACESVDVPRPEVQASLLFGSGEVVDESGEATFFVQLDVGDASNAMRGPGLLNVDVAEVHYLIRTHGPVIPELLEDQLTTFDGGCEVNICENVQAGGHNPDPGLLVSLVDDGESSVEVRFTSDFDLSPLNVFDAGSAEMGPADAVVEGSNGPIAGSLVVDSVRNAVTFIKSGGPLAPDSYTVRLRSGSDAFQTSTGRQLDGNGDGFQRAEDVMLRSFTVSEPPADSVIVSLPDFVRGPGQPVNIPANTDSGLPLSLSDGEGVRAVELQITYDPQLLDITDATVTDGMPDGATVILNSDRPGSAVLVFLSPTPLPAGEVIFATLEASVPVGSASEIYGRTNLIDLHSVQVSDGANNAFHALADDALHVASYFGDVSGNGRINGNDAAQAAAVAAAIDSGFGSSLLVDPVILGDISGNGRLNAFDASRIAAFASLLDVPEIPTIPGAVVVAAGGGAGGGLLALPNTSAIEKASDDGIPATGSQAQSGSTDDAVGNVWVHPQAVDSVMEISDSDGSDPGAEEIPVSLDAALEELLASGIS